MLRTRIKTRARFLISAKQVDDEIYVVVEQVCLKANELGFKTMYFQKREFTKQKYPRTLKAKCPQVRRVMSPDLLR